MPFSFQMTFSLLVVFTLIAAMPFLIRGYKKIRLTKSAAEIKVNVLQKASEHWDANSGISQRSKRKPVDPIKKKNIRVILKLLAEAGEIGILPMSISDKSGINMFEINNLINYLIKKMYAEVVFSASGTKYYLTELGNKYCINKKYI